MSNTLQIFAGFETGDTSEVVPTAGSGNTAVASTTQANSQYGGIYSCHISAPTTNATAAIQIDPLKTDGTQNAGASLGAAYITAYFYLVSVTGSAGNGSTNTPVINIAVSSGTLRLRVNSSRKLELTDIAGSFHTGTTVLSLNTWYRIDLSWVASTGAYAARVNGTAELSGTTSTATGVSVATIGGVSGNTFEFYVDDIWFDSTDYAPACGVTCYTASSNGNYTAWSGTASNAIPPSSTGALTSTTSGDIRTVTTNAAINTGSTINAVKSLAYVKPPNGGSPSLGVFLRSNTTDDVTSGATSLGSSSYSLLQKCYQTDPATSAPWTVSAANAAQPGVKNITAGSSASSCEAIYLMVAGQLATTPAVRPLQPMFVPRDQPGTINPSFLE